MNIQYFPTHAKCIKCGKDTEGHIGINLDTLIIADSNGFMVFDDGVTCDDCINIPDQDEPLVR